jgi:hypothetical protein
MVLGIFGKGDVIARIKAEELRNERIRLEMERDRSFKKIEDLERKKGGFFKELLQVSDRGRKEALATSIANLNLQGRLEQTQLQHINGQLRTVHTIETIKEFQSRNVKSPVLSRLLNTRPMEVERVMMDLARSAEAQDRVFKELTDRLHLAAPETPDEVQKIIATAEKYASVAQQDPEQAAEKARQDVNREVGLEKPEQA